MRRRSIQGFLKNNRLHGIWFLPQKHFMYAKVPSLCLLRTTYCLFSPYIFVVLNGRLYVYTSDSTLSFDKHSLVSFTETLSTKRVENLRSSKNLKSLCLTMICLK